MKQLHIKGVTSLSEECIFTHEFIHATGGFEMQVLDEGYTSILTSSMLGTDKRIDGYDRYRWCVEEILHLVDKKYCFRVIFQERSINS